MTSIGDHDDGGATATRGATAVPTPNAPMIAKQTTAPVALPESALKSDRLDQGHATHTHTNLAIPTATGNVLQGQDTSPVAPAHLQQQQRFMLLQQALGTRPVHRHASPGRSRRSGSKSLQAISERFMDILNRSSEPSLSITEIEEQLRRFGEAVTRRRLSDVVNVLEGVGVIERVLETSRSYHVKLVDVNPSDSTLRQRTKRVIEDVRKLSEEERHLNALLETARKCVLEARHDRYAGWMTAEDVLGAPFVANQTCLFGPRASGLSISVLRRAMLASYGQVSSPPRRGVKAEATLSPSSTDSDNPGSHAPLPPTAYNTISLKALEPVNVFVLPHNAAQAQATVNALGSRDELPSAYHAATAQRTRSPVQGKRSHGESMHTSGHTTAADRSTLSGAVSQRDNSHAPLRKLAKIVESASRVPTPPPGTGDNCDSDSDDGDDGDGSGADEAPRSPASTVVALPGGQRIRFVDDVDNDDDGDRSKRHPNQLPPSTHHPQHPPGDDAHSAGREKARISLSVSVSLSLSLHQRQQYHASKVLKFVPLMALLEKQTSIRSVLKKEETAEQVLLGL